MRRPAHSLIPTAALITALLAGSATGAGAASPDAIGLFTALRGTVTDTHPGQPAATKVNVRDDVLFKDLIETQRESRTKALFQDDTLLTLGENSRIAITEHVYDPSRNSRSMTVNLAKGKLRALVGKVFEGAGSKFEIHTPSAVAAARGTYFVVWIEEQSPAPQPRTGVVNIGDPGIVAFTSGGKTVLVGPQQYSVAAPGQPPSPPAAFSSATHPDVQDAIVGTELEDLVEEPGEELPVEKVASPIPPVPITPPAVISGAAGTTSQTRVNVQIP
jgi:hypothetical protein